jgi:uncharacterized protein YciI
MTTSFFSRTLVQTARFTTQRKNLFQQARGISRVMASQQQDPEYHVLQYSYVPDILEKRGPYRAEHLEGARKMAAEDKLVMAGALADPVDGGLFIFKNISKEEIEEFAKKDPYVIHGLVPQYDIRKYMVVATSSLP